MEFSRNGDTLKIRGSINNQTFDAALYQLWTQQFSGSLKTIDLQDVEEIDSVCISLLVDAVRQQKEPIAIINAPESVRTLLSIYHLKSMISA